MALTKVMDLDCDNTIAIGGKDGDGKSNPTGVKGFYLGYRKVDTDYGEAKLHVFQTKNGNLGVWGKTDLDRKLSAVELGNYTEVTFAGMKASTKKGRKPSYKYDVAQDSDNAIEVSGLIGANAATESDADRSEEYADDDVGAAEDGVADEEYSEADPEDDTSYQDEAPPAKSSAPKQAAKAPDAARRAKVDALLLGRKAAKAS